MISGYMLALKESYSVVINLAIHSSKIAKIYGRMGINHVRAQRAIYLTNKDCAYGSTNLVVRKEKEGRYQNGIGGKVDTHDFRCREIAELLFGFRRE